MWVARRPVKEPSVRKTPTFIRGVLELCHEILGTSNQAEQVNQRETDLQGECPAPAPINGEQKIIIIMGGTRDRTDLKVLVSRSAGMASALNLALCICEHDSPPPRIRRFTFWHHCRRTTRWARDFFFDWLKRKPEKGTSGPPLPKPRRLLCGLYFGTSRSPCVRKPQKI